MTTVSIITAAYNAASFLDETIESVRRQTLGDYEHLIVDDASVDHTRARAEWWAARDPRIRVLAQTKRAGPAQARNRGLAEATSDFVAFIDSDDVWHPDFLAVQHSALEREPAPTAGTFCYSVNFQHGSRTPRQSNRPRAGRHDLASFLRQGCPPSNCSSLLLRRATFERVGPFTKPLAEDTDMWLRMLAERPDAAFLCLPHILIWRRIHSQSRSTAQNFMTAQRLQNYEQRLRDFLPAVAPAERAGVYLGTIRLLAVTRSPLATDIRARWQRQALALPNLTAIQKLRLRLEPALLNTFGPLLYCILLLKRRLVGWWERPVWPLSE